MLVRLPKSAISICPIVLLCLISYANYTIYSFRFNVWLPKNAQGKRSLLIQECMAQLPHPCEASNKLIPQISPSRRKYLLLLHHIHMNRCGRPTAPLLASLKSRMKPTSAQKSNSQSNRTMSRWNMLVFLWEHSLSYPGLAALTHENFTSVEAQDFSDCLTLTPAHMNICDMGLALCWPCTGQILLTFSMTSLRSLAQTVRCWCF